MTTKYVNVTVRLIIELEDGETIDEVIQEMDYNFTASPNTRAIIKDTEIRDFEINEV